MPQSQQFYGTFVKLEFYNIFGSQMPDIIHWLGYGCKYLQPKFQKNGNEKYYGGK